MLRIVELRVAQGPIPTCSLILIGICSASAAWCSSPGFFRADSQSRASGSSLRSRPRPARFLAHEIAAAGGRIGEGGLVEWNPVLVIRSRGREPFPGQAPPD